MTDRTNSGRNLDDALNRLYQDWDEQVVAPRLTYLGIRENLDEQERPSLLSMAADQLGRLTAKWRIPVTKSQIGSISAVVAIVVVVALYVMVIGPGANDAEEIVPAVEPTATNAPAPTATEVPTSNPTATNPPTTTPDLSTSPPTPAPAPVATPEPTVMPTPAPTATRVPLPTAVPTATPIPYSETDIDLPSPVPAPSESKLVQIPAELQSDSEPLDTETVIAKWNEFLENTRMVISGTISGDSSAAGGSPVLYEFGDEDRIMCAGGRGFYAGVPDMTDTNVIGQIFSWEVNHSPAAPWHSPIINTDALQPELAITFSASVPAGLPPGIVVKGAEVSVSGSNIWFYTADEFTAQCESLTN